jgi:predicted lysophospholipase L1 biosynthesis ABC-type transport system permease subunit
MSINGILLWFLDLISGLAALLGALLVGWNSIEVYYLVTGTVQPDFEQPPLTVVVPLLIFGLVLLFGGWRLHKRLRKDSPF